MRNALTLKTLALVASAWWIPIAWAQPVAVADAWARATVTGQKASGVFMKLTAAQATRLVGASSPVAGVVEVHEMKMEKDVMKMAAIAGLDLPAGGLGCWMGTFTSSGVITPLASLNISVKGRVLSLSLIHISEPTRPY